MFTNVRSSRTQLVMAVIVGAAMIGMVGAVRAQEPARSDRKTRTVSQVRRVRQVARTAFRSQETPVVQLSMTFSQPVGLIAKGERPLSPFASQGFIVRSLDADRTEWGVYTMLNDGLSRVFDVLAFRDHVLVILENSEMTTGLVISLDREAKLVDAVVLDDDDAVASVVEYDEALRDVLEPTTESAVAFLDSLMADADVALAPEVERLLPTLADLASSESLIVPIANDPVPSNTVCCVGPSGCFDQPGECPAASHPIKCPCSGS